MIIHTRLTFESGSICLAGEVHIQSGHYWLDPALTRGFIFNIQEIRELNHNSLN